MSLSCAGNRYLWDPRPGRYHLEWQEGRKRLMDASNEPEARLREAYLGQLVTNVAAMAQTEELAASVKAQGLRLAVLKGAAAILWLYGDPGCRRPGDLDLLVEDAAPRHADGGLRPPVLVRSSGC